MKSSIPNPNPNPYQTYLNAIKTQEFVLITQQHPVLSLSKNSKPLIRAAINEITAFVKADTQLSHLERTDLNNKIQTLNTYFNRLPDSQNLSYFRTC